MIGNTAIDAIKFMRDTAILAGTDAGSRIYVSQAKQSESYPLVVMDIISREESPTQDSGSAVDTYRIQVDVFAKSTSLISGFEKSHNIATELRQVWSRSASAVGNYDNAVDSIQEVNHITDYLPDLDVFQVTNDYMVRMAGAGISTQVAGTIRAYTILRKKVTLTHEDFATGATTNTIDAWDLPAKGLIHMITLQPSAFFTGGAIASYTVEIGKSGETDAYLHAQSVFSGASPEAAITSTVIESMSADTTITATATSTGANLDAATAGTLDLWIYYSILN